MREPGEAPRFDRLIEEVQRAQHEWLLGNRGKAEAILKLVGSYAYAEARERGPNDPVPERASAAKGWIMQDWQPIETAPKDGTCILWCHNDGEFSRSPWVYCIIRWPTYKDCFDVGYWMPLPEPPADSYQQEMEREHGPDLIRER